MYLTIHAEMESVCIEAYYLEQALMDQRGFAAAFDATFAQVPGAQHATGCYAEALLRRHWLACRH